MMALILFLRILPQQDLVYSFFLSAHSAWSDKLRRLYGPQILFNLVTQAEKQFGSGTGSLKYAAVADWIYQRIPAVLKLLFTSSDIEKMIEAALEEAKKAWGANENLKGYIDTPSVESLLVGIEGQAVQTEPAEN